MKNNFKTICFSNHKGCSFCRRSADAGWRSQWISGCDLARLSAMDPILLRLDEWINSLALYSDLSQKISDVQGSPFSVPLTLFLSIATVQARINKLVSTKPYTTSVILYFLKTTTNMPLLERMEFLEFRLVLSVLQERRFCVIIGRWPHFQISYCVKN